MRILRNEVTSTAAPTDPATVVSVFTVDADLAIWLVAAICDWDAASVRPRVLLHRLPILDVNACGVLLARMSVCAPWEVFDMRCFQLFLANQCRSSHFLAMGEATKPWLCAQRVRSAIALISSLFANDFTAAALRISRPSLLWVFKCYRCVYFAFARVALYSTVWSECPHVCLLSAAMC